MAKMSRGQVWLLVILVGVGLGILGYYVVTMSEPKPQVQKTQAKDQDAEVDAGGKTATSGDNGLTVSASEQEETGPSAQDQKPQSFPIKKEEEGRSGEDQGGGAKQAEVPGGPPDEPTAQDVLKIEVGADIDPQIERNQNYCALIDDHVRGFFVYLDQQPYVEALHFKQPPLIRFQKILDRLAAHPPLPAAEKLHPGSIFKNLYHLYRVLDIKDIWLIKEVLAHEKDDLEINLDIFYKWLMSKEQCPDTALPRPSFDVLYQYAGFFLNTIGGRAYLFRRAPTVRLLISYYAVMIVHRAEKLGKNSYGIDPVPTIAILKEEIKNTTTLEFQMNYLDRLTELEHDYLKKR